MKIFKSLNIKMLLTTTIVIGALSIGTFITYRSIYTINKNKETNKTCDSKFNEDSNINISVIENPNLKKAGTNEHTNYSDPHFCYHKMNMIRSSKKKQIVRCNHVTNIFFPHNKNFYEEKIVRYTCQVSNCSDLNICVYKIRNNEDLSQFNIFLNFKNDDKDSSCRYIEKKCPKNENSRFNTFLHIENDRFNNNEFFGKFQIIRIDINFQRTDPMNPNLNIYKNEHSFKKNFNQTNLYEQTSLENIMYFLVKKIFKPGVNILVPNQNNIFKRTFNDEIDIIINENNNYEHKEIKMYFKNFKNSLYCSVLIFKDNKQKRTTENISNCFQETNSSLEFYNGNNWLKIYILNDLIDLKSNIRVQSRFLSGEYQHLHIFKPINEIMPNIEPFKFENISIFLCTNKKVSLNILDHKINMQSSKNENDQKKKSKAIIQERNIKSTTCDIKIQKNIPLNLLKDKIILEEQQIYKDVFDSSSLNHKNLVSIKEFQNTKNEISKSSFSKQTQAKKTECFFCIGKSHESYSLIKNFEENKNLEYGKSSINPNNKPNINLNDREIKSSNFQTPKVSITIERQNNGSKHKSSHAKPESDLRNKLYSVIKDSILKIYHVQVERLNDEFKLIEEIYSDLLIDFGYLNHKNEILKKKVRKSMRDYKIHYKKATFIYTQLFRFNMSDLFQKEEYRCLIQKYEKIYKNFYNIYVSIISRPGSI